MAGRRPARGARAAGATRALALEVLGACGTDVPVAAGEAVEVWAAGQSVPPSLAPAEAQRVVNAGGYFTPRRAMCPAGLLYPDGHRVATLAADGYALGGAGSSRAFASAIPQERLPEPPR